jgi:hypothetical protein
MLALDVDQLVAVAGQIQASNKDWAAVPIRHPLDR